jgi:chromosome partitioning protein
VVTVIGSLKGGSGKSTVTFNLAVWLKLASVNLLVIDADPQATLTDVAEVRSEEGFNPSIRVYDSAALTEDAVSRAEETLIDIGTSSMENVRAALALADRVVIPVPPSQADIWSAQRFIQYVRGIMGPRRPQLLGFINRGDTHQSIRESDEAAAALVSLQGLNFIKPRLCQRTVYRRSFSEGLAVFELEPRGKAATELDSLVTVLYPHLAA